MESVTIPRSGSITATRRAAKAWLSVFLSGFAFIFFLFLTAVLTRPPTGDLTRIARISDYQFGWREPPPPIALALAQQSPIESADILVVGDSFSIPLAWQSELVKAGYRVVSTHWDQVLPICQDFESWLRSINFKGRLVLLASVERYQGQRLMQLQTPCASMMNRAFTPFANPTVSPSHPPPKFRLNLDARLTSGVKTWLNTRKVARTDESIRFKGGGVGSLIYSAPVPDGCRFFSHPMCNKGLFLFQDKATTALTPADAQAMAEISKKFTAYSVNWIVIPNKTTVYLDPSFAAAFGSRLQTTGAGPDLFSAAQLGISIRDLYMPNDSHWSIQGHLYFGRHILDHVTKTLAIHPPEAP